ATGTDGRFVQVPAKTRHATLFYQNDLLGTPQELLDESGKVVWLGRYRAWGGEKTVWQAQPERQEAGNPIRFQGQYHDDETRLHYNRHRYYDPGCGRFISKDPIGLQGGLNAFQYTPNPITWVDALGLTGKPLPGPTKINRIGGNSIDNLRLKEPERKLNPPGISVLHGCCPCAAAQQMRNAFPRATGLLKATETVASGTADAVRGAGFDVIEDPTNKFPNHARIIHPGGADGFSDENLERLSDALGKTTGCPR
ncbi:RHS repeat-associated core domain-containing protein, partial [Burkholderia ubonensis]|uniref:RHS repeat-associated core domain-containing protein n=1 Tax=Burkholderia ubonensis TaxID=101571 RepID=UPI0018DFF082